MAKGYTKKTSVKPELVKVAGVRTVPTIPLNCFTFEPAGTTIEGEPGSNGSILILDVVGLDDGWTIPPYPLIKIGPALQTVRTACRCGCYSNRRAVAITCVKVDDK